MSLTQWKRKEWTTRCSDPTTVVRWTMTNSLNGVKVEVTEFQGVYGVEIDGERVCAPLKYWEERHKQLEAEYWREEEEMEQGRLDVERAIWMDDAERELELEIARAEGEGMVAGE